MDDIKSLVLGVNNGEMLSSSIFSLSIKNEGDFDLFPYLCTGVKTFNIFGDDKLQFCIKEIPKKLNFIQF